jgi:DNA-binding GntR family transcriptional regulator
VIVLERVLLADGHPVGLEDTRLPLETNPAAPMLLLNRVARDAAGRPIERVRSLFRGDRFSFVTTLRRG